MNASQSGAIWGVTQRSDLGAFLKTRRDALRPEDVGMLGGTRRRTKGLRREEVALLANVSVSWYTWLEQGRPVRASSEVLHALADALRCDEVERTQLLILGGQSAPSTAGAHRSARADQQQLPLSTEHLLVALLPAPAYVIDARWNFVAWNEAFATLFPRVATLSAEDRNLVWVVFGDATARLLIGDWEQEARRVLSQFRAETATLRDDPALSTLVDRLNNASEVFRQWWTRHDVGAFESHRRVFHHESAGRLEFETQQLIPADARDLRIVVHLPLDDDDSAARLAALTENPTPQAL